MNHKIFISHSSKDASTPPIEKRINELKERIMALNEEDVVYLNAHQLKLKK